MICCWISCWHTLPHACYTTCYKSCLAETPQCVPNRRDLNICLMCWYFNVDSWILDSNMICRCVQKPFDQYWNAYSSAWMWPSMPLDRTTLNWQWKHICSKKGETFQSYAVDFTVAVLYLCIGEYSISAVSSRYNGASEGFWQAHYSTSPPNSTTTHPPTQISLLITWSTC